MKILKLRGNNIRSLYGHFELDLERPPFDRQGLFAITGPTGAGKSTLLDVICLALYGVCPRLENQKKNAALINRLTGSDPRTAISRGASGGFAEVIFESQGNRYRARWEVHRSGKKSSFDFAKPLRELMDDVTGAVISDQTREVDHQLALRTQLTYDQFSRSVLLAQGDFASFLKASPDDRSALLEAITGLDIYTYLSIEAHRQGVKLEAEIKQITSDIERIQPPSDQSICDIEARIRIVEEQILQLSHTDSRCQQDIRWYQQEQNLLNRLEEAEKQYSDIQKKCEEAIPLRILLERALKAASIRTELEFFQKTRDDLKNKLDGQAAAEQSYEVSRKIYDKAVQEMEAALILEQQEKNRQEQLQSSLDAARQMDIQVQQAKQKFDKTRAAYEDIVGNCRQYENHLKELEAQNNNLHNRLLLETNWLQEQRAVAPIAQEWQYYQSLIQQIESVHEKLIRLESTHQQIQTKAAKKRCDIESLVQKVQIAQEDIRQSEAILEEKRQALDAIDQTHPHDRLLKTISALTQGLYSADQLVSLSSRKQTVSEQIANNEKEFHKLKAAYQNLSAEVELLHKKNGELRIRLDEAAKSLDFIRNVLSCDQLRSKLQPGKPCMVCGSTTHPYVTEDYPHRSLQIQEELRINDLNNQLQQIVSAISDNSSQMARTEERMSFLQGKIDQDRLDNSKLEETMTSVRQQLADCLTSVDFQNGSKSIPAVDAISEWKLLICWMNSEKSSAEAIQNQKKELSDILLQMGRRYEKIQKTHQQSIENLNTARHELMILESQIRETESHKAEAIHQRQQGIDALAKTFDSISAVWESECIQDPSAFKQAWKRQVTAFKHHQDAQKNIQTELAELTPKLIELRTLISTRQHQLSDAKRQADQAAAELDEVSNQRKKILDGRLVKDVEKEFKKILNALEKSSEKNRLHEKEAAVRLKKDETVFLNAKLLCNKARKEYEEAENKLQQALQKQGLELSEAQHLNQKGESFIRDIQNQLKELDTALTRSAEAVQQRRKDIDSFLETSDKPTLSKSDLEKMAEQAALDKKQAEADLMNLLTIRQDLIRRRDEAFRLQRQLDVVKEKGKWRQILKEVIGHHTGDKFRKFAQTITLKQLVILANDQLMRLAPRYQLTLPIESQNLEMAVIDQDQASEIRQISTLSGGETFLVSLALSLALSKLSSRQTGIKTLFIDEGFGLLDTDTLDSALATLEMIQSEGKLIGLISHVPVIQERIACQVRVISEGAGRSRLVVKGG